MKCLRKCGLVLTSTLVGLVAHGSPNIDAPVVLPEAVLTLSAPDVHGLLDGVGGVASQVSPMMNGMMLKNLIGMQVGDPGLAGIPVGGGMAVVAMDKTNAFAVLELNEALLGVYTNVVSGSGMQWLYEEGALIVAQDKTLTAKGKALLPAIRSTLFSSKKPVLRMATQPAEIIERNQESIEGLFALMPMMMGMQMQQAPGVDPSQAQSLTRVLEAELRVLLSLAAQTDQLELVLTPSAEGIRIDQTLQSVEGSRLGALLSSPIVNTFNEKVRQGMMDEATVQLEGVVANPEASTEFFSAEAEALVEAMSLTNFPVQDVIGFMKGWNEVVSGSYAESIGFDSENVFSFTYGADVNDEAAALKWLQNIGPHLKQFEKLYASLGLPMAFSFKENVRTYKEQPVHQLSVKMDMENLPAMQQEQMKEMNLSEFNYDIAFNDGVMLYAMDNPGLETLIDRAGTTNAAVRLKACEQYSEGGVLYLDMDIGKYFMFTLNTSGVLQDSALKNQLQMLLQDVEPIVFAAYRNNGRFLTNLTIPADLVGKIGQAGMMIQMQSMQQGGMQPVPPSAESAPTAP